MESAQITYSSNNLIEFTYQIAAESGDWIVIDKYTPSDDDVLLRRANLMAQENLQIIQEAVIHGGSAEPFRVVSVTTLDGEKAELSNVDFPTVPVRTDLSSMPPMQMVLQMRNRAVNKLCKRLD